MRQRQLLLRANQLITADVERGMALAPELVSACNLAGRQPWLQILGADGSITTYSLGSPPSAIWRGQVLMRCGPAYGLDGQIKAGSTFQNRVVLDGLTPISGRGWLLIASRLNSFVQRSSLLGAGEWLGAVATADGRSNGSCTQKAGSAYSRGDAIAVVPLDWLAWDRYLPLINEFVIGASPLPGCLGCSNGDADG